MKFITINIIYIIIIIIMIIITIQTLIFQNHTIQGNKS